jgi:hypothetical protein
LKKLTRRLSCALVLLVLSEFALAGDSFTARIPAAITAGNYAEAEMLIAEAVKIGVITAAAAQLYRGEIRQARERPVAKQQDKKQQIANDNKSGAERSSPSPLPDKSNRVKQGRIYATYTKFNEKTGRYYSGRTSMVIDLEQPHYPQALVAVEQRDANHHLFGGAWSDTGEPYKTENALRGVAKANPQGRRFHEAATSYWGKKSEYTGD